MKELIFYSYPSCTSCRKTKHWLKAHNIDFQERHLFRETPSIDELKQILSLTTEGIDEILATRSQTFKNLNLNIEEMTVNEVLKLLTEKPKLLRRPILIDRKKLVVGYNPGELMKLTKKKTVHQSVS
ncbi:Spx/MgsR family RNA polymerase-binding regulatory protein [Bacillus siamensis]|uniref:Spx/MgsR family RNA polymerase-binding regulatory protein n=1 Tax=Bacillus siamensis TaxID=659243 RepID=UPI0022B77818|nr:Spx/MgsR family RNA polymerase-binding regulatory protein [Bacillus siamensis]MDU0811505.1 Spx/MgsR family RNA polymerase-binding regulatory protein [Bacillus siamensis]MED5049490.1 Spx/MgsR family RNA polymerase-binding regulatory protein [Bacillus siamensis]MED5098000.1 Spx/MgsR family RNA polymerase-binding regulatory protein [Bacillus siamensis]